MDKVVIITGASGGLGSAMALQFGAEGARVVVNYNVAVQDAEDVVKEINSGSGDAFTYRADVCNFREVKAMVEAVLSRWGRIDVLVNNAGGALRWLGSEGEPVWEMEEELWDTVVDINLKGTFLCTKAVAPQMIKQRDGHIINVSSGTGLRGRKGWSAYAAAKTGMIGFTKSVARELGEYNIKVNTVMPGLTPHNNLIKEGRFTEAYFEQYKREQPVLHRIGTPEEFAMTVVHLTQLQNMSGQLVNCDNRILF